MTFIEKQQIKAIKRMCDSYIEFITEFRESAAFLKVGLAALESEVSKHGVSDKLLEAFLYDTFNYGIDRTIDTEIVLNQEWFYLRGTELYDELLKYHEEYIDNMMDSVYDDEINRISSLESLYKYISEDGFSDQLAVEAIEKLHDLIASYFYLFGDEDEDEDI